MVTAVLRRPPPRLTKCGSEAATRSDGSFFVNDICERRDREIESGKESERWVSIITTTTQIYKEMTRRVHLARREIVDWDATAWDAGVGRPLRRVVAGDKHKQCTHTDEHTHTNAYAHMYACAAALNCYCFLLFRVQWAGHTHTHTHRHARAQTHSHALSQTHAHTQNSARALQLWERALSDAALLLLLLCLFSFWLCLMALPDQIENQLES